MTIKQQGGIFGRNPTFNNVDIDGDGTVEGVLTVNGFSYFNDRLTVTDDHVRVINSANTSRLEAGVDATSAYLKATYSSGGTRDLRFLSLNAEIARITANGLTFNGDTAAANALDDYEEGAWTPTYVPGSGAFDSITYSAALTKGWYTKVGNLVHVTGQIRTDAITVGTASGAVSIGGLPFTCGLASIGGSAFFYTGSIGRASDFAGDFPSRIVGNTGQTYLTLRYRTAGIGADSALDVSDLGTGSADNRVIFDFTYTTS